MFKYFIVIFVFWYHIQGYAFAQYDTILKISNKTGCNEITEEIKEKPVITMNGHNNYHVGQQIFYIYNEQKSKTYPDGYVVTSGIGAHKVYTHKLSWNKAREACIQEGGHLAVINSVSEEKILLDMLGNNNLGAWLGLHDQFEEGNYVTVRDVPLQKTGYIKWTPPNINPDNLHGNQNCIRLIQLQGGMDDLECSAQIPFICEIPA